MSQHIMFSNRSTFFQSIQNRRGQVALFIALVFQILFLFFAMVINVGLLVHHKINLQNSVDLAAYYGAMKQAEGMNAIGHINYQIRQSWKLLAWRYRMLGSAGEFHQHPYKKPQKQIVGSVDDIIGTSTVQRNYQEAPAFCITYIPFKPMPPGENTCKDMAGKSGISVFKSPPLIAGHQVFSAAIIKASEELRMRAFDRCKDFGSYNYFMLAKFVTAFNIDQAERMNMISLLSQGMSTTDGDFYDIDGKSVKDGIVKTLRNNLTSANSNSELKIQVYNSLGSDSCGVDKGAGDDQPAKWLSMVKIYPGFSYIDTTCDPGASRISTISKELGSNPAEHFPTHYRDTSLRGDIEALSQYVGYRSNINDLYNFSLGVEKNPWCMAYVGVAASANPRIPFSPFGTVTLKARAFYKPFGGRIGPWHRSSWSRGSRFSNGGKIIDPLIPPRYTDISALQSNNLNNDPNELARRATNHSRFVGDNYGLKTLKMLGYYGKAIFELDPRWKTMTVGNNDSAYEGTTAPNFADWDHLPFAFSKGSGDILAWDQRANAPSRMRNLELLAILPDAFDIAYYSIQPDYYKTYYTRIRNGFLPGPGKDFISKGKSYLPDIGYHKGYKAGNYNFDEFSVKDQYMAIKESGIEDVVDKEFTFITKDWRHSLTGFKAKNLMDYSLDTENFGKCADGKEPDSPTSGHCVVGGSTGYSVKLVSSKYLSSEVRNLGGEGASGTILNPPPEGFGE